QPHQLGQWPEHEEGDEEDRGQDVQESLMPRERRLHGLWLLVGTGTGRGSIAAAAETREGSYWEAMSFMACRASSMAPSMSPSKMATCSICSHGLWSALTMSLNRNAQGVCPMPTASAV